MSHVLTEKELDLFHPAGRTCRGLVVVQSGKRRLKVDGKIPITPNTCFVPLPGDVAVFDAEGKEVLPSGKKRFFISVTTINPHIIVEAWYLPMAPAESVG